MWEQLSSSTSGSVQHRHAQMTPVAQERLLLAARTELDALVKSRFPPPPAAAADEGQPPWQLALLLQACSVYAACAAAVAAGADKAAAVQAWSHAELTSGVFSAMRQSHCTETGSND